MDELVTLTGTVEDVVFASEDTGFAVLALAANDELVTVVGTLYGISVGEEVKLTGRYGSHPTYGQQFKAEIFERRLPATASAILKYLSSGAIKGIGPRTAVRIVEKFGDDTLSIIEKQPDKLSEINGISLKKAQSISDEYKHIFGIRSVMLELSKFQLEPAAAIRVWKQWGPLATEVIRSDPYQLCCEAVGIPFEKADTIAMELEINPNSPARLRAGIAHVLQHNLGNGHTCLPTDKLLKTAAALLEVETFLLEDILQQAVEDNSFVSDTLGGTSFVYLPEMYEAETYIAGRIQMMMKILPREEKNFDNEINSLEKKLNLEYAKLQKKAIGMALSSNVFILTGGPGTGKTTALNGILSLIEQSGDKVALAAPTGRAAKRMSELTGREAKTIHRLLEVDYRDGSEQIKFKRNEKNPLRFDTIILDEVSMVDTRLLHCLMKALKLSCRLILVGDPDQLPSVGAGNILRDLIECDIVPTVHLSEIFRQASQSAIVSNAHLIVTGENPDLAARDSDFFFMQRASYDLTAKTVVELCSSRLPKAYGFSPLWDIQVIVPSRIGALGTVELNKLLQLSLNPAELGKSDHKFANRVLRERDKVMQIKNNYDLVWKKDDGEEGTGIFNGDIGVIEMLDRPSQSIFIRFEDRVAVYTFEMADEIEHAWAITVHKSQGSEFEAVIMPLMSYHQKLYYRNILYTCVTRAKKIMVILGQQETVYRTVANHRKVLRYTNLARLLTESVDNG